MNQKTIRMVKTTILTVTLTVLLVIFRQAVFFTIVRFDLPTALLSLTVWLLLILVLFAPRQVFYVPLFTSQAFSLLMIYRYADEKANAVSGTLLNLVLVIVLYETFRLHIDKLKDTNRRLAHERERADEATKKKDVFLAKMSHELRTPLNGIIGITDLLLSTPECRKQRNNFEMIREAAGTLHYLIDDLLDLSRIEIGILSLHSKTFQLKAFLRRVCSQFEAEAKNRSLDYMYVISDTLPDYVEMDNYRLQQIITNLVTNSIKYTDENGSVRVDADTTGSDGSGEKLRIRISDTGRGIPPEEKEEIFRSFYRSIDAYNNQSSGVGIGLYIVKHLVGLFNGTIDVQSEVGQGSIFTVVLPIFPVDEDSANAVQPCLDGPGVQTGPLRILIAEDNYINSYFIRSLLEKKGHTLTMAKNGAEAVNAYIQHRHDLILMDIQMPGMSGIEAVKKIREYEKENSLHPVHIAAITAYATESEKKVIVNSGFDSYISKPVDCIKLQDVLQTVKQPS